MLARLSEDATCVGEECHPVSRAVLADTAAVALAHLFKSLADPTRVRIVSLLDEVDELCVCDINANFNLEPSTMSHHLKVLREAGIIAADKRGLWVYYRLLPESLSSLARFGVHS